jgi:hypothetical protein
VFRKVSSLREGDLRRLAGVAAIVLLQSACGSQTDLSFFVLVKSSNYAQDSSGQLTLLNHHFFSEIFLAEGGSLDRATLTLADRTSGPLEYVNRGSNFYVEGGHFDTLEELDRSYPNGTFAFDIVAPSVQIAGVELQLAGPEGETDLPAPITISLFQQGRAVSPLEIDPEQTLVIRWSAYSNGRADPRGVVDDMIFVVVADCHGQRLYHTGLPFQSEYLTYETTEVLVDANTLSSGQAYSMFVEFPHVVDSRVINGVPGFTSYATATYLDVRTTGPSSDSTCPDVPPPMDTGQTDRGHR